jgi:hypothetical protein
MAKNTIIFSRITFQNLPKLGFLVWKNTIWQHWIPGSYARKSMITKGRMFQLISTLFLWSGERFCRPLKNSSFEVNYLVYVGRVEIGQFFTMCFFPQKIFAVPVPTYLFCLVLKFIYFYTRLLRIRSETEVTFVLFVQATSPSTTTSARGSTPQTTSRSRSRSTGL